MKVHHVLEDYSIASGGIRTVVKDLNEYLANNSEIITTRKESQDINVKCFEPQNGWQYTKGLKNYIVDIANNLEESIFHIHGVWMFPQYFASKSAKKNKKPYIITPHGMYEPWLWKQGFLKKKIYFELFTKNYFSNANIMHAITEDERDSLYKLFNNKINIEVIPNLIPTWNIPQIEVVENTEKYILFLGRIHPKKGVRMLIEAFSKIKIKNIKLKIAGPNSVHQQELIHLVSKLNLKEKVEFLGAVKGAAKFKLYKEAHVFVAPSYSEVVGMVNLEAAIMGTPVITTHQTGLLKQWNSEGGILINPNNLDLKDALTKAVSWTQIERNDRGKMLKEFVLNNYSWERNKNKWDELYGGLLRN